MRLRIREPLLRILDLGSFCEVSLGLKLWGKSWEQPQKVKIAKSCGLAEAGTEAADVSLCCFCEQVVRVAVEAETDMIRMQHAKGQTHTVFKTL